MEISKLPQEALNHNELRILFFYYYCSYVLYTFNTTPLHTLYINLVYTAIGDNTVNHTKIAIVQVLLTVTVVRS